MPGLPDEPGQVTNAEGRCQHFDDGGEEQMRPS